MNANAPKSHVASDASAVHDAWGVIDPRQSDVPAVLQVLRDEQLMPAAPRETHRLEATSACAYCGETLMPNDRYCSRCLRPVAAPASPPVPRAETAAGESARTENPPVHPSARVAPSATYALEAPARCPHCENEIRTFRVIRVLRTQVSFTSTLPRKGYVIVCPECEGFLSAELSGLI